MARPALLLLLGLAACPSNNTTPSDTLVSMQGWRTERGKPPTQAEFTALAATCEAKGGSLDTCLGDMGLQRDSR